MAPEGAREKNIVIKGPPEAIEAAKRLISEKIGGGYDDRGHGGGRGYGHDSYGGGYDAPQQHAYQPAPAQQPVALNPSTGQPDYSAQWAEYYRSLGMMKEAEMIESQARGGSAAAPQPQAAPQPAMAAQPDYSAQWAEYYRSIGQIKEAEAIEQNMRAKAGSVPPAGYPQPQPQYGAPQYGHPQPKYY